MLDRMIDVLVVDDTPDHLCLLQTNFERAGCTVRGTPTAEAAIAAYDLAAPDIAVIDLLLPGMDGWELANRVRVDLPDCAIVITSVLDVADFPDAHALLPKPFTSAQVRKILQDLMPTRATI